jgi:hypothetical protein
MNDFYSKDARVAFPSDLQYPLQLTHLLEFLELDIISPVRSVMYSAHFDSACIAKPIKCE